MAVDVIMPKVDMDMVTGKVSKWHVNEGDAVKKGQLLFEIETDKSAMEIESPGNGIVRGLAATSLDVPVGQAVAFILAVGEVLPAAKAAAALNVPAAKPDVAASVPAIVAHGTGLRATPLARRLARQRGLTLSGVAGSGPRGRIVAGDVEKAAAGEKPVAVAVPQPQVSVASNFAAGSYELMPLDGMRRTIAQRLQHAKQTVPHFYLTVTCKLDNLQIIRERLNASAPRGPDKAPLWKLSVNDFVIKALGLSLQKVPDANVTWSEEGILQHRCSDVGVAVAVEGGLFTPVVRGVERKTLSQIALEMKDLASRARLRKLQPSEYQGGTTAVSNLGMYGIEEFAAIINPPQATILAVGAGIESFVPVDGKPVLKTLMKCTLSCDHRAVDGALGAQLLVAFKQLIEEPALMLA